MSVQTVTCQVSLNSHLVTDIVRFILGLSPTIWSYLLRLGVLNMNRQLHTTTIQKASAEQNQTQAHGSIQKCTIVIAIAISITTHHIDQYRPGPIVGLNPRLGQKMHVISNSHNAPVLWDVL